MHAPAPTAPSVLEYNWRLAAAAAAWQLQLHDPQQNGSIGEPASALQQPDGSQLQLHAQQPNAGSIGVPAPALDQPAAVHAPAAAASDAPGPVFPSRQQAVVHAQILAFQRLQIRMICKNKPQHAVLLPVQSCPPLCTGKACPVHCCVEHAGLCYVYGSVAKL